MCRTGWTFIFDTSAKAVLFVSLIYLFLISFTKALVSIEGSWRQVSNIGNKSKRGAE